MGYHEVYMDDIAPPPAPAPEPEKEAIKPLPILIAVLVLLLAGGALWYILTRPGPDGQPAGATSTPTGTVTDEKQVVSDQGQYHDIKTYYPASTPLKTTAGARADGTAVALMRTFAEQEAARFEDANISELSAQDIAMFGLGENGRKYTLEADYDLYQSPVTVSYVYHMYADTLGAHPNAYYRTFTFDKNSGEGLLIDDLFASEDYLDVLSNETRTRLRVQMAQAMQVPQSELDTEMLDAGTTPFVDNFGNFYLEGADLIIVFPPYQVGPWALGTQEVRIPRASLGNALVARYR